MGMGVAEPFSGRGACGNTAQAPDPAQAPELVPAHCSAPAWPSSKGEAWCTSSVCFCCSYPVLAAKLVSTGMINVSIHFLSPIESNAGTTFCPNSKFQ